LQSFTQEAYGVAVDFFSSSRLSALTKVGEDELVCSANSAYKLRTNTEHPRYT
jgi:hypothetical protein